MKEFINILAKYCNAAIHILYYGILATIETLCLRSTGVEVGKKVKFRGWVHCFRSPKSNMVIGDGCTFNHRAYNNHIGMNHRCNLTTMNGKAELILGHHVSMSSSTVTAFKSVRIGDHVRIGANCVIMDGDFHLDDPRVGEPQPVIIENNVWLGYGVIVKKGVTIGENSVIGTNSIVTHDIPANVIAAGMPAKVIKELSV